MSFHIFHNKQENGLIKLQRKNKLFIVLHLEKKIRTLFIVFMIIL